MILYLLTLVYFLQCIADLCSTDLCALLSLNPGYLCSTHLCALLSHDLSKADLCAQISAPLTSHLLSSHLKVTKSTIPDQEKLTSGSWAHDLLTCRPEVPPLDHAVSFNKSNKNYKVVLKGFAWGLHGTKLHYRL